MPASVTTPPIYTKIRRQHIGTLSGLVETRSFHTACPLTTLRSVRWVSCSRFGSGANLLENRPMRVRDFETAVGTYIGIL
jgi:hypothetical protein